MSALFGVLSLLYFNGCDEAPTASNELGDAYIYDFSELDEAPRLVDRTPFNFPRSIQNQSDSGNYEFAIELDPEGRVVGVEIVQAKSYRLAKFIAEELQKRRFTPPLRDGVPVRAKAILPVPVTIHAETDAPEDELAAWVDDPDDAFEPYVNPKYPRGEVFEIEQEVSAEYDFEQSSPPEMIDRSPFNLPLFIRSRDLSGVAVLRLEIDTEGNVRKSELISADHHAVGECIRSEMLQRKFSPAVLNGEPVKARANLPIPYTISAIN